MCGCCWAIGVFSLFFLARLRVMSLCRITLVWVDILVCCPVECLEHLRFARLVLGSWCSAQLLSRVVLGGGLLQSGRVVEQLAELLVRDFSWTGCLPCGFGADSEGQWCVVLGLRSDYRFLVWVTVETRYPLPELLAWLIFQIGSFGRFVLQRVIRSEWRSGCVVC